MHRHAAVGVADDTEDLLERAHAIDDPERRRELCHRAIEGNLPIAMLLARQYAGRGVELDDLEQVAMLALCHAVQRYDPRVGRGFAAFAVPTIRGELRRHFRDHTWLVRPSRSGQELTAAARALTPLLTQHLGRDPKVDDLAVAVECSPAELRRALGEGCLVGASLDAPFGPEPDGTTWAAVLPDTRDSFARLEDRLTLADFLCGLDERDQRILHMRYVDDLTQEQIGRAIGVSQMQISRILARIVAGARDWFGAEAAAA